jgi:hypothetical protein
MNTAHLGCTDVRQLNWRDVPDGICTGFLQFKEGVGTDARGGPKSFKIILSRNTLRSRVMKTELWAQPQTLASSLIYPMKGQRITSQ